MSSVMVLLLVDLFLIIILIICGIYSNFIKNNNKLNKRNSSSIINNSIQKMLYILGTNTSTETKNKKLEEIIHPCGFYKNKAKNALACSQKLVTEFNSIVPNNMEDLMSLPGIGRKSANVIMLEAFHDAQGIAVDTHARRISNKIGFSKQNDPEKIEQDLLKQFSKEDWVDVNHLFVWHGRYTCTARSPKCEKCPITKYCNEYKSKKII